MNEPISAVPKLSTWTPGAHWATTMNETTWRTSTRMPTRISETGAARARTTGRMAALNSAIRMTATTASCGRSIVIRGRSQAVARNEIVATTRVMTSRLSSATRPPFHSQSTRSWVA